MIPISRELKAIQDPQGKSKGRCDCRHQSPDKTSNQPRSKAGFFVAAGNTPSSHPPVMTLDTQMTLALPQELLLALRANEAEGFKSWLALGIEELGRDVATDLGFDWMGP